MSLLTYACTVYTPSFMVSLFHRRGEEREEHLGSTGLVKRGREWAWGVCKYRPGEDEGGRSGQCQNGAERS